MKTLDFDDRNITWNTIEGFDHIAYFIYDVDERNRTADLLFKFAANEQIALHRHMASYRTVVLQGELRIYDADGKLRETRPVGSYVTSQAGGAPHREGGGEQDTIVFFSNREVEGAIYEILGPDQEIIASFSLAEFKALQESQKSLTSLAVSKG